MYIQGVNKIEEYNLVVLATLKKLQLATQCSSSVCLYSVVIESVH
jgi:hypothetical protein